MYVWSEVVEDDLLGPKGYCNSLLLAAQIWMNAPAIGCDGGGGQQWRTGRVESLMRSGTAHGGGGQGEAGEQARWLARARASA